MPGNSTGESRVDFIYLEVLLIKRIYDKDIYKIKGGIHVMLDVLSIENLRLHNGRGNVNRYKFTKRLEINSQNSFELNVSKFSQSSESFYGDSNILSDYFGDSINGNEYHERFMIGIDGGGTKTEFILFSHYGNIVRRIVLDGCNPNVVGIDEALCILKLGIDTLLKTNKCVCGIFVGSAGLDSGNNTFQVQSSLEREYPGLKIRCENDIFNVIACGKNLNKCVAAICGTGMIIYINENGKFTHLGGRGYLLDKGGSGYHIGRDAIYAAQDVRDGLKKHSILTDLVEQKLGDSVWNSIHNIYKEGQSYISSFTHCVIKAYENGDNVAELILKSNAEYLAKLINFAIKNYDVGKYIVASGGILKEIPCFGQMLKEMLEPDAELDIPNYPPVYGACIMCCKLCNLDLKNLEKQFMIDYDLLEK